MESTSFVWDPNAVQVYDKSYGSQTIMGHDFSKSTGCHFTLDARDETLVLQVAAETQSGSHWPTPVAGQPKHHGGQWATGVSGHKKPKPIMAIW